MTQQVIAIDSPIQTIKQFSASSGLTERQVQERIKDGSIPFVVFGERGKLVNVAKLAAQLLDGKKAKESEKKPTLN